MQRDRSDPDGLAGGERLHRPISTPAAGRPIAWGVVLAVGAFLCIEAMILAATYRGPAAAARLTSAATLTERVERDPSDSEAAAQELYERLRAGRLDDASLVAAARAMWSAHVGLDAQLMAGRRVAISVQLATPRVLDDDFADGRPGPELEWRLREVTLEDGHVLALKEAAATRTPLSKFAPTVWRVGSLPASTPTGPTRVRGVVEFAVRARPDGPIVGTWTRPFSQAVEVVAAID